MKLPSIYGKPTDEENWELKFAEYVQQVYEVVDYFRHEPFDKDMYKYVIFDLIIMRLVNKWFKTKKPCDTWGLLIEFKSELFSRIHF